MSRLKNISIRHKQMLIITLTSSVALLLACAGFVIYDTINFRRELTERAVITSEIIGNNCTAALDFNDAKSAEETLESLHGEPNVVTACLFDRHGDFFTAYRRDGANARGPLPLVQSPGEKFVGGELQLFKPVIVRGETLGTIYLAYDLTELQERRSQYLEIVALVFAVSLLAALILSSWLQRVISDPILQLAKMTRRVAAEKNYSLRAAKSSQDELGQLVDGFNEMLTQIQARDVELQKGRELLEGRVAERTAELTRSLAVLNATFESTTDGIFAVDLSGRITSFNSEFATIWGLSPETLIGRNYVDLTANLMARVVDPVKSVSLVEKVRQAPEKPVFDVVELKDGRVFERHAMPQRVDGECVGVVVNWRDITERKHAEDALRHTQALYHSLVDQIPAGIYRKDADGRYVFVNKWFCEMFGLKLDDCLGKTPMEVAASDLANPRKSHLKAEVQTKEAQGAVDQHAFIMQTGKPIEVEEAHAFSDGVVRHLQVIKTPVFDSAGKIVGSQGIQFEVTQQKQMQIELAYERDLLRALMENFPDSIYFKDLQSRFVRVSRSKIEKTHRFAAEKYSAQHPGEKLPSYLADVEEFAKHIVGKSDEDFLPHEFAVAMRKEEQEIIQTGKPLLMKLDQTLLSDGKESWYLSSKLPWRDHTGKIIGTFGTTKDITTLKDAEAKLEMVHRELLTASRQAGMAEVASNVLHNVGNVLNSVNVSATVAADIARKSKVSSLGKVVGLLEEHAGDLGEFLSQNPKGQQIPGYLKKLHEHLAQEQQVSIGELESLRKNIEHIKDIVTMQQSYAKMSGLTEVVKVSDLVEDSLRMNAGALQRHEVEVVREYAEVPVISVEKHKVLQILVNLIRNAKYACDEGGRTDKRVTVRIANGEGKIKIAVVDNGIGIPEENLTRIFNHGFTTRANGHGFGLHSGALAAKEMGGTLMAQSAGLGTGAVFILELPLQPRGATA